MIAQMHLLRGPNLPCLIAVHELICIMLCISRGPLYQFTALMTSLPKSVELLELIQDKEFKVDICRVAELLWSFIVFTKSHMTSRILIRKQSYSFPQHSFP
jgi:hypothetical protein